ncbi:MAG TPA: hypothetical protein VFT45_16985 [Longimicrobium sp.]|nr:hypothetical protein [Longimicrobium sp.]
MKKLTLDLNALLVQSFTTDDDGAPRFGTIHGRQQGETQGQGYTGGAATACSLVKPECDTAEYCPQDTGDACTGSSCPRDTGDACTGSSCPRDAGDEWTVSSCPRDTGDACTGSSCPRDTGEICP